MRPVNPIRRHGFGAASALAMLAILLPSTHAVWLSSVPASDSQALIVYVVAPSEGPGLRLGEANMAMRNLKKEMINQLANPARVRESTIGYGQVTKCDDYPCEVLVEEVEMTQDNLYTFKLESKLYLHRVDRWPQPDHNIDPWPCQVTQDLNADDCRKEAPKGLAHNLKVHDETFHSRTQ